MKKDIVAIDLFCGIGGLTHGLQKAGIKVLAGIDTDESCQYAYEANNKSKFIKKDVAEITGKELKKLCPTNSIKILVGCAPCQTFSTHTQKNKKREQDERWGLLYHFLRLVKEFRPDYISMENVPQLRKYQVFNDFVDGLRQLKYSVHYEVANCLNYGTPQRRSRLVLLASKKGPINLIPKTHSPNTYKTLKEAIGHLPPIKAGNSHPKDPLHRASGLSPLNIKRIKQSKPGGSWMDWDETLRLPCHKKECGTTYKSVYGRMKWDSPAPTITTQFYGYGTGRFGHPTQNRALSLREGALLQTFPASYKFVPKHEDICIQQIGRHIGNSVPVQIGKIIGKSLKLAITQRCSNE